MSSYTYERILLLIVFALGGSQQSEGVLGQLDERQASLVGRASHIEVLQERALAPQQRQEPLATLSRASAYISIARQVEPVTVQQRNVPERCFGTAGAFDEPTQRT